MATEGMFYQQNVYLCCREKFIKISFNLGKLQAKTKWALFVGNSIVLLSHFECDGNNAKVTESTWTVQTYTKATVVHLAIIFYSIYSGHVKDLYDLLVDSS